MDLKEYVLPKSSIIGGWYIPPAVCDDLIKLFKDNKDHQTPGVVGPPLRVDPNEKVSTEVPIHPSYDHPTFILYKSLIQNIVHSYEEKYPEIEEFSKFGMGDHAKFSIINQEKDLRNGILNEVVRQKIDAWYL